MCGMGGRREIERGEDEYKMRHDTGICYHRLSYQPIVRLYKFRYIAISLITCLHITFSFSLSSQALLCLTQYYSTDYYIHHPSKRAHQIPIFHRFFTILYLPIFKTVSFTLHFSYPISRNLLACEITRSSSQNVTEIMFIYAESPRHRVVTFRTITLPIGTRFSFFHSRYFSLVVPAHVLLAHKETTCFSKLHLRLINDLNVKFRCDFLLQIIEV
jgi:hypothetical protein